MGKAIYYGGGTQFFDNSGDPLAGGFIYTYEPGTTTAKATYKEAALTNAHENPIELDAYGRPPGGQIWFSENTKALVYDADNVLVSGVGGDNLNPDAAGLGGWATKNPGVITKSANYALLQGDDGNLLISTAGTWTLSLLAAATAGDGFTLKLLNVGTGTVTLDGDGAETINGAATVTLAPWEGGELRCDGTNWRFVRNGGLVTVASGAILSASPQTSLDLTDLSTGARAYLLVFDNLKPVDDNVELFLRLSDDAGASYEADTSDYAWAIQSNTEASSASATGDDADSEISMGPGWGNGSGEEGSGFLLLLNPAGAGITNAFWMVCRQSQAPAFVMQTGGGQLQAAGATTAFRLIFVTGSISTMNYTLYSLGAAR